jgi:membrane fusion protein (multidrug efflux system)
MALTGSSSFATAASLMQATTTATSKNINSSEAAVTTANAQIEAAKVNVWKTSQDLKRYAIL